MKPQFPTRSLALLVWCLTAVSFSADIVFLKDGSEIEGRIEDETPQVYMIRLTRSGGLRAIKRSDVDVAMGSGQSRANVHGHGGNLRPASLTAAARADTNSDVALLPMDTVIPAATAFGQLDSDDGGTRTKGQQALRALGKKALPVLLEGLYHPRLEARVAVAEILGGMGAREATKGLIEALHYALPGEGPAEPAQRPYVEALSRALERVTGQTFMPAEASNPAVQDGLRDYVAWYAKNRSRLPDQVGEAAVDPQAPDAKRQLEAARKLQLEKRPGTTPAATPPVTGAPAPGMPPLNSALKEGWGNEDRPGWLNRTN